MTSDTTTIPNCPACESHRITGRSRRENGGEQYMAWVCNECSHQFEVIEVETIDNSMAARRARKRWWMAGGRRR
jgi:DNA-directed RNA polymerase subunit RPC12/RpoP